MNNFKFGFGSNTLIIFILIIIIASFFRLYKLNALPASLYWDEVAIGYNAYSISETLRDEYGKNLPLLFKSYNDYKMPLYVYIAAISIKIFSLNEISVRLPSAIFGVMTVALTFFLVRKVFEKQEKSLKFLKPDNLALVSAFLLSISPWHIQFSRGAFEANSALFFLVLGMYLYLKGINRVWFLFFAFFSFGLAFYAYRSVLIFLPVLIIGSIVIYRKEFSKFGFKRLSLILVLFIMFIFPITNAVFTEGTSRFTQTSISNEVDSLALEKFQDGNPVDRKLLYISVFLKNYLSEFSPGFLFIEGDPNLRHSPNGMGMIYIWEAPFIILGLIILIVYKKFKIFLILSLWLLASALPASLSTPAPHALRSLNMLPIPHILTAVGILFIYHLKEKKVAIVVLSIIATVSLVSLARFIAIYQVSYSKYAVKDWGDGYKQLYAKIIPLEKDYDKIVVSGYYWQPYAYALFYKSYSPEKYQKKGNPQGFDKYNFGGTSWDRSAGRESLDKIKLREEYGQGKILIALSPSEYDIHKDNIVREEEIKGLNGETFFILGELN